jgi:ABC-type transport system involved in multi-copper enzyme maturation permease subunit
MISGPVKSVQGILTIAHLTWMEARRKRTVLAALLCGLAFLAVFAVAAWFAIHSGRHGESLSLLQRQMMLQTLTMVGLYAVNFFVVALAVILPVDTLSGEIASGTIQTIASKPVNRADIVLGKWLVHALMIAGYLVVMAGGILLIMWLIAGFVQRNVPSGLALMLLEALVLLTVTIAGGVRFSTVTNGIVAFGLYALAFIGGLIEQVGVFVGNSTSRYIGTAISLVSPTDALWRLAAHELLPPFMSQLQAGPFSSGSTPSAAMAWWSVGLMVAVLMLGIRGFQKRAL